MATLNNNFHFQGLPDVILSKIFSMVTDTRTRNAMSLVCLAWYLLERSTRTCLTLRGSIRHLQFLPTCFRAVTNLDLSFISPWGHALLDSSSPDLMFLAQLIRHAFPSLVSLTIYVRNPSTLSLIAPQWPNLRHVKLVRWHRRLSTYLGADFLPVLEHCHSLSSLDLSHFYCWTEDLPPALEAYPTVAASLSHLNILNHSSCEGYKSHDLLAITAACPNLRQFLAMCIFDHRFIGYTGDETLLSLASNCPRLSLLHLVDATSSSHARVVNDDVEVYTYEGGRLSHSALVELLARLPFLEELVLEVSRNVTNADPTLDLLNSQCPRLKSLTLGQFHGICWGMVSRHGVALCSGLISLSLNSLANLSDSGLIALSIGCPRLTKFEVVGCNKITEMGITKFTSNLRKNLIDVKISCCKHLNAMCLLRALHPIQDHIQRLHVDCVWASVQQLEGETSSVSNPAESRYIQPEKRLSMWEDASLKKKCKYHSDVDFCHAQSHGDINGKRLSSKSWPKLQYLSLWILAGELLSPLTSVGLEECPLLEEIQVRIEGDCRQHRRPPMHAFGLSSLVCYPRLSKMNLDCASSIGYALTAPTAYADLSMWERFYLNGVGNLKLTELNYWPPHDTDIDQRTLSLPAAGLLAQCATLRKLFIHGTANEHLIMFLLKISTLRDVQVRQDYLPAPENDIITEMRVGSCHRFEDALNRRQIPD